MAKKKFSKGIDAVLGGVTQSYDDSPKKKSLQDDPPEKKQQTVRTTLIVDEEILNTIKAIAYWERKTVTALFTELMTDFINTHSKSYLKTALNGYNMSK